MPRPKAPPRVNGPYPDRDGTRFRVRIFHHDLQRQDLYFHTELEPCWEVSDETGRHKVGALTFIDPAVGGSGFLDRAAAELNLVAARALDHLDHKDCESACYRCLKNYQNQRVHEHLSWPRVIQDLEVLRARPPERLPVRPRDESNPSPWLAAYAAGVGSPLELDS